MAKAPIKIPNLIPVEKLEIANNQVTISGFKASDKVYEIAIQHIRKRGLELQAKVNKIIFTEEDIDGKKELRRRNDIDISEEERNEILKLMNDVDDLDYQLVYGDKEDQIDEDRMNGPMALLAQRGLKRYYYPGKTSSELDEIDDIEITEGDVKAIANTMINLTKPPSGLEKSIQARERENTKKDADKGK
ncbi:hypothetical protein [Methanobacterium sp.]|uniref:hypothetical protein n=1 Tax=Methanobacterium sp. TaxID=2164 RepID=UPI002ABBDC1C|nr:hypothetical protein [Methanobacterium sp.]MDY9922794.1 hypothetical protein [Methanobacterium sp.]